MDRSIIVGAEPDYDKLLSVGADTVPPPHPAYAHAPYAPSAAGQHALAHAPHHHHPGHHGHHPQHPHHVHHAAPAYPTYVVQHAPPPPVPHYAVHAAPALPAHVAMHGSASRAALRSHQSLEDGKVVWPIGFTAFSVPPGPPVEIEAKPQVQFRGLHLAVGDSIAKDFIIADIKVGTSSQLGATGEIGAELFSTLAVGTHMLFERAAPGTTITLRVRNISEGPQNFFAALYGEIG